MRNVVSQEQNNGKKDNGGYFAGMFPARVTRGFYPDCFTVNILIDELTGYCCGVRIP